jgi:hypothetical protein
MRRLVWASWYQGVFGDRVKAVLDQASRHNFQVPQIPKCRRRSALDFRFAPFQNPKVQANVRG